jgi:hypothetical protein
MAMMGAAGGSLISGIGGMLGAGRQAGAANQAAQQSAIWQLLGQQNAQQMLQKAQGFLQPYTDAGNTTIGLLTKYMQGTGAQDAGVGGGGANLLSTFAPTMAQLESTPGYQWARKQALGAMTSSGAAKGMGASGNLVQGIGETATGLASQTFQDQLKNYLAQNQQAYNMLMGPSQIGAQSAGTLAQGAMNLGGQMLGGMTNVGNTIGAGIMGGANALAQGTQSLAGGIGSGVSSAALMPYMQQMYGRPGTSYGTTSPAFAASGGSAWQNPLNIVGGAGPIPVPTYMS